MDLDFFLLLGNGIGNVISGLYAVEYLLHQKGVRVGFSALGVPDSFKHYLAQCYGTVFFVDPQNLDIHSRFLIHSYLVHPIPSIRFESYFYVKPDAKSTVYQTETEQYLSIARSLRPSEFGSRTLQLLKFEETARLKDMNVSNRIVLYPGCMPENAAKRWPHYFELIQKIGIENVIVLGANGDLDFSFSYVYPEFFASLLPQQVLDRRQVWKILKTLGLLRRFSHQSTLVNIPSAFFSRLSWQELLCVLKQCRFFVGNDGGIMHLAAAVGTRGVAIFGPTSIEKNRPYNESIRPVSLGLYCQPCQFGKAGITMSRGFINCPYGLKCLQNLDTNTIHKTIVEMGGLG